jgi:dTDP-4-dehydrorhamnose reductase
MILICGASGLLGKEICSALEQKEIPYIGTYNNTITAKNNMYKIDFSNLNAVEDFLVSKNITSCIFCIVMRLTDVCENNWNEIKKTNIDLVFNTSSLCNKLKIKFIHISTDYVFDGFQQPNLPNSIKNPLQNYGISKLISEYRVINNCKNTDYCIIRTPVLYSNLSKIHDNAVCLIGKSVMDLRTNKKHVEDNYSIRRPLFIADLCEFILECIYSHSGIFHFYNPTNKYTKYQIAEVISSVLDIPHRIIPNNSTFEGTAQRPYDTQLMDDKIDIMKYKFIDFDDSINKCFHKFKHPKITVENKDAFFFMIDMDGTIINTNDAHYISYKYVFEKYNRTFLTMDEWNEIITNGNFDNYLLSIFDIDLVKQIKQEKLNMVKQQNISFTKNSELFIDFLIDNHFNFCIVTNTNNDTVEIFKEKLPLLKKIEKWVSRNDYTSPKPNRECYDIAKTKYYNNEKYIIGIEDTFVGYNALKPITDIIYIYENEQLYKKNDCYLFDDYNQLYAHA